VLLDALGEWQPRQVLGTIDLSDALKTSRHLAVEVRLSGRFSANGHSPTVAESKVSVVSVSSTA
jgi:hypothetical protein